MPCYFRAKTFSLLSTVILTSALGACDLPPAYFAEQLDAVPVPAPVLMRRVPGPDCPVRATPAAAEVSKKKGMDDGGDFEIDSSIAGNPEPSPEKETTTAPDKAELMQIKKERDCYRRAEQVARQRLNKLQVETTRTVTALDGVRHRVHPYRMRP